MFTLRPYLARTSIPGKTCLRNRTIARAHPHLFADLVAGVIVCGVIYKLSEALVKTLPAEEETEKEVREVIEPIVLEEDARCPTMIIEILEDGESLEDRITDTTDLP